MGYSKEFLLEMYKELLFPRLIEEKMLIALRQGRISKWFSAYGQEAISVGATMALEQDEYILTAHRNLGVFTTRGIPLKRLFAQFQGKSEGFTKGRDRSFHFGAKNYHIVGMISHLATQLSVADGIALGNKLKKQNKVVLAFVGDGATSEGEFHEALNIAAVWDLPVIFLVENNSWGLSTPSGQQFRCENIVDKASGYGMKGIQVDGNNVLEVFETVRDVAKDIRKKPYPVLIEAITYRIRGHEESSGVKYVPKEEIEHWSKKDPIDIFQKPVLEAGLNSNLLTAIREELGEVIQTAFEEALMLDSVNSTIENELLDVYADSVDSPFLEERSDGVQKMRFIDAVREAQKEAMELYPNLILMGQDIAAYGGVFKATEGLLEVFGEERVRNTPICESAIIGVAMGLSIQGYKSMVEMQFSDFVTCAFNQIVNYLAKNHYRWGENADVVIRMPSGAGVGAGPFHSQTTEAWFFKVPGLKVVYPSNPSDAKALLLASFRDPNPVLFFEHKALYRKGEEQLVINADGYEIGKATVVAQGDKVSIITYGMGVVWAKELISDHKLDGQIEILDLRTLLPWDKEAVRKTVKKNNKVLLLTEDSLTGSVIAELSAWIAEECFEFLDAPVVRVGALDTPIPFAKKLEEQYLPKERLFQKITSLLKY